MLIQFFSAEIGRKFPRTSWALTKLSMALHRVKPDSAFYLFIFSQGLRTQFFEWNMREFPFNIIVITVLLIVLNFFQTDLNLYSLFIRDWLIILVPCDIQRKISTAHNASHTNAISLFSVWELKGIYHRRFWKKQFTLHLQLQQKSLRPQCGTWIYW